jgi:hypothetical protein
VIRADPWPELFRKLPECHVFVRSSRRVSAKRQELGGNTNGMVIADFTAIAFVPTKTWAWLTKGGERNALDDFCNSVDLVVTRRGK